jgi:hypothetical protein
MVSCTGAHEGDSIGQRRTMAKANEVPEKHPSETRNCAVSFDQVLESGESLTGTPTVTATPAGLAFSNQSVSITTLTINGAPVTAGRAAQFAVAGGSSGITYKLEVACSSTSSPAQSVVVECKLLVLDN